MTGPAAVRHRETAQLAATAYGSNGDVSDATGDLAWSSSDPSVAAVDEFGAVTGVAAGVAVITSRGAFFPSRARRPPVRHRAGHGDVMPDPLFSDGQIAALVTAVLAAGGTIAGAIKWAVSRLVSSHDAGIARVVKAVDDMAADNKQVRDGLIELRAEVREGRADIRELRELAERLAQPRRTGRRAATIPG